MRIRNAFEADEATQKAEDQKQLEAAEAAALALKVSAQCAAPPPSVADLHFRSAMIKGYQEDRHHQSSKVTRIQLCNISAVASKLLMTMGLR